MSGDWKDLEYKDFNLNAKGAPTERSCLHPLLKVRKQLKDIFLQMGFGEMPTNNYVESRYLQLLKTWGYGWMSLLLVKSVFA
ncbi:hypothetical protein ABKV19_005997 [Rosa sericea]